MNAVPCRGQRIILNRTQLCLSDVKISKDRVFISVVFFEKTVSNSGEVPHSGQTRAELAF